MRVTDLDVQLKSATRQVVYQGVRNTIMTTNNFHTSYKQNSVEHQVKQISSVSENTLLQKHKKLLFR